MIKDLNLQLRVRDFRTSIDDIKACVLIIMYLDIIKRCGQIKTAALSRFKFGSFNQINALHTHGVNLLEHISFYNVCLKVVVS